MNTKVYKPSMFIFWLVVAIFSFFTVVGAQRGHLFTEGAIPVVGGMIVATVYVYLLSTNMYVKIVDNMNIIINWHDSFKKVEVRLPEVKYILRVPRMVIPGFGIKMLLYVEEGDHLKHVAINEYGFNDKKLHEFLEKIRSVKPNVILDAEYEEFLGKAIDPVKSHNFSSSTTKNTVASVEQFLKNRGEKLN